LLNFLKNKFQTLETAKLGKKKKTLPVPAGS
jgi:hypothetical protein